MEQGAELLGWLDFPDGPVRIEERYYLVSVLDPAVDLGNLLAHEWVTYRDHRWWSLSEIRASDAVFFPPGLADLLEPLVHGAIPPEPIRLAS